MRFRIGVAIAAVLVLAGCSSGTSGGSGGNGGGSGSAGASAFASTRWLLAGVTSDGKAVPIPAGLQSTLQFPSTTAIVINDSLNTLTGVYTPNSNGFTVTNVNTTLAGYNGADPGKVAVIQAVDALASGGSSPTSVNAKVNGDQLVATTGSVALTYSRAGSAAPATSPAQTSPAAPASS